MQWHAEKGRSGVCWRRTWNVTKASRQISCTRCGAMKITQQRGSALDGHTMRHLVTIRYPADAQADQQSVRPAGSAMRPAKLRLVQPKRSRHGLDLQ